MLTFPSGLYTIVVLEVLRLSCLIEIFGGARYFLK